MSWEGCFRESLAIRLSGIPQEVQVQSLPLKSGVAAGSSSVRLLGPSVVTGSKIALICRNFSKL